MNPLVAPGVCRYTVNGTYAGRVVANVLDMHVDITGTITDRATALEDQANIIVSAWADEVLDILTDNYTATSVSWLDLATLTGSTGSTTTGTGTDFPASGAGSGNSAPGNVAIRVNKNISATRGQRQGRMYLVGMDETMTDDANPNTILSASAALIDTKLAAFLAAINQNAGTTPPNYDSDLCVLHTHVDMVDPNDPDTWILVYDGRSSVNSLTTDLTLGSQRRRLRG